jgi:ribonuclease P protein component
VVRNRVKRAIREWFRCSFPGREEPWEIVVIARSGAKGLGTRAVAEELSRATQGLVKAGAGAT